MTNRLTVGSLFSGIGGLDLGFERAGFEVKWQVEIDPYCQRVLAKHWPEVKRFGDIRECGAHNLPWVDVLVGGFPCQDISIGNTKGEGIAGARSGLWSELYRTICELRPRYAVVENVPALLHRGLGRVLGDLAEAGYDTEWDCIPVSAIGGPHHRNRIFITAYPQRLRLHDAPVFTHKRPQVHSQWAPRTYERIADFDGRPIVSVPTHLRVDDGISSVVDRLRGLGNAVVPQVAQYVAECVLSHAQQGASL